MTAAGCRWKTTATRLPPLQTGPPPRQGRGIRPTSGACSGVGRRGGQREVGGDQIAQPAIARVAVEPRMPELFDW